MTTAPAKNQSPNNQSAFLPQYLAVPSSQALLLPPPEARRNPENKAFMVTRMPSARMQPATVRPVTSSNAQTLWNFGVSGDEDRNDGGTLQKSEDGGRSWQPVRLSGNRRRNALSVNASEIWAGGEDGALFHSADTGLHWNHVPVMAGANRLTGTIKGIVIREDQNIRLTVVGDSDWTSPDGGLHRQKQ